MTTITPMIRARGDGIPGLAANGHTGQQSMMDDQSCQLGQLSIDRSSSAIRSVSISSPSINMLRRAATDEAHSFEPKLSCKHVPSGPSALFRTLA